MRRPRPRAWPFRLVLCCHPERSEGSAVLPMIRTADPSSHLLLGMTTKSGEAVQGLKQVPQELVVDLVVELNFRSFDERAELPRATIR
jgi:hypothetical protein